MEVKQPFDTEPHESIIKTNPDGSRYIPINELEDVLDSVEWSTRNFSHTIFKNGYADLAIMGSLELVIKHDFNGKFVERSFVGAANFPLKSIDPNQHFLATLKSECIKNAASDIGVLFGRHLNDNFEQQDTVETTEVKTPKVKPDSKIMKKFLKAVEEGDTATQTMLSNIYEIKTV